MYTANDYHGKNKDNHGKMTVNHGKVSHNHGKNAVHFRKIQNTYYGVRPIRTLTSIDQICNINQESHA
ncbi:hypothetical protein [Fictibacillus barbaricus]|uniref:hypothetical protein n=1 Tax=Fictibacillus barbaricus TaxID=182136 RepID=UPI00166897AE|nr:hypothetical protein [Fictibacillus barbaricus]GGB44747.1 hypothetical protein GCM10007199_07730 [Fictibacillus barbaricus]